MGFVDKLRNTWNNFTGNNYDDDYEDNTTYNQDMYSGVNMTSSAPDYSYYEQPYEQEQEPVKPTLHKTENFVTEIAMVKPSDMESVRDAASHLIKNRAVVLSLKDTESSLARRWLDYLGGATYAVDGKINRIAPYTYLLTPKGVELVAGFETEA